MLARISGRSVSAMPDDGASLADGAVFESAEKAAPI
jgi:hypothetical protein